MSPEQKTFYSVEQHSYLIHYVDVSLRKASDICPTFSHSSIEIWVPFITFHGYNANGVEVIKILRQTGSLG